MSEENSTDNDPLKVLDNETTEKSEETRKFKYLILCGGGMRGIALLGALRYLEEKGLLDEIHTYIGTSCGSMIAALLNIGFSIDELFKFMLNLDISSVAQFQITKIITHFGLDSGNTIVYLIKQLFIKKGFDDNITFKSLYELTGKHLIITGTDVNEHSIKYLDYENTPNLRVVDAIRISSSIPFLFTAPLYKGHYYVDGGVLDNFPYHLVSDKDEVIALKLGYKDSFRKELFCSCDACSTQNGEDCTTVEAAEISSLEDFSINLVHTLLDEIEYLRNKETNYKDSTIIIKTEKCSSFSFNMEKYKKQELFDCGYESASQFI